MMIFDTHCHLNDDAYEADRELIVNKIEGDENFLGAIVAGTNISDSNEIIDFVTPTKKLFSTVGIHPEFANDFDEKDILTLESLSHNEKVVAIGEIGLDYYWKPYDEVKQKKAFISQLKLASSLGMPAVIHQRNVGMDILEILKAEKKKEDIIVLHCFSESVDMAREFVKLGCFISFAGPLTFKNAKGLLEVGAYVPEELILAETDSPYLTPQEFRGKRNEPHHTQYVVRKLADIRGVEFETLSEKIIGNVKRAFSKVNV